MYSIRKNGFGDCKQDDSSSLRCEHGELLESCKVDGCAEIWLLYQDAVDEKRREYDQWVYTQNAKRKRRKTKSEFEIALEKSRVFKREDYEPTLPEEILKTGLEPEVPRKLFQNIFADETTFRVALQFRVLKLSEVCLIKAYLASDQELPDSKRWAAIGKRLGVSGKTVERRFRLLVEKLLKPKPVSSQPTGTIKAVHVRGERRLQYYRKRSIQIGEWRRDWWELITDKRLIRELCRQPPPMIRSNQIAVPLSPVNAMSAALIERLASDCQGEFLLPEDVSESDLEFNVSQAKRMLAGKTGLTGPRSRLEIAKKLVRGANRCGACRSDLIRGFWISGRKITRVREYCDDSCKMRAARRKRLRHVRDESDAVAR
jgi:hypothetical protein